MSHNGGIILVGGHSSRMGASKASLEWHGSTLVRRVAGIVSRGVGGPVVLVRSPGQPLPSLPSRFEVLDDLEEHKGPLGGMSVGLEALGDHCRAAYVSSTDVPFLHPAFVRRVLRELGPGTDACVPFVRGFRQPLAAAYSASLAPTVESLLSSDRLRVGFLLEACRWTELDEAALLDDPYLARLDPGLESVTNLNDPEDYQTATAHLQPLVHIRWCETGAPSRAWPAVAAIRAATLGSATEAAGASLSCVVALNGKEILPDPEEPLVEGDVVSLTRVATAT